MKYPALARMNYSQSREFRGAASAQRANNLIYHSIHPIRCAPGGNPLPSAFMICQFCLVHTPGGYHIPALRQLQPADNKRKNNCDSQMKLI
jgi:hypothetical protein